MKSEVPCLLSDLKHQGHLEGSSTLPRATSLRAFSSFRGHLGQKLGNL